MRTSRHEGGAGIHGGQTAGPETLRRLVDMIRAVEARTSDRAPAVGNLSQPPASLTLDWPALDPHALHDDACGFASCKPSDQPDAIAFAWSCTDPTPPPHPPPGHDPHISNQKSEIRNPLRLSLGAVHEWIGTFEPDGTIAPREPWTPPILLLSHLLWCALEQTSIGGGTAGGADPRRIIWIGKRLWPHGIALLREDSFHPFAFNQRHKGQRLPSLGPRPHPVSNMLPSPTGDAWESAPATVGDDAPGEPGEPPGGGTAHTEGIRDGSRRNFGDTGDSSGGFHELAGDALLRRSIFVDPPDDASRLWAIDLALRSPAVLAVVADGSRLDMSASRRLQLAAESTVALQRTSGGTGGGALALVARPPDDRRRLSAAATRWLVRRRPSAGPAWSIHLLRAKASHAPLIPSLRKTSKPRPLAIRRTG